VICDKDSATRFIASHANETKAVLNSIQIIQQNTKVYRRSQQYMAYRCIIHLLKTQKFRQQMLNNSTDKTTAFSFQFGQQINCVLTNKEMKTKLVNQIHMLLSGHKHIFPGLWPNARPVFSI